MDIQTILSHSSNLKAKVKVETISKLILGNKISVDELIKAAKISNKKEKGTCIESIEFATRTKPDLASIAVLSFVTETLLEEAPRVKWESAKVIGNIAHLFPGKLNNAIKNLLVNTEYSGTVVRWSAAFALGEVLKLKTSHNKNLIPAIEAILSREENSGIRKIYQQALKKVSS